MPQRPNNTGNTTRLLLYIFGVALIVTAIFILLKGAGILSAVPSFVIWAFVLVTIGAAILGGIGNSRGW
ncbi:MAG: hypothetical protein WBB82_18300 [Limnothrix sp.]